MGTRDDDPVPGTMVCFHAHPDDECIGTGGVIAQAAARGHRVVLVLATRGELGEAGGAAPGAPDDLARLRTAETERAAQILGIARIEYLGYHDSGMAGSPHNDAPGSFWSASVEEAATRLASILVEEDAEVLTVYDDDGVYGHPDHIQVHRVGVRAAELAGTPRVYEATMNVDALRRAARVHLTRARAEGVELPPEVSDPDDISIGVPEARITTTVDVRDFVDVKRSALAAHASQVDETSFFLAMPLDTFRDLFGTEWFIRRGRPPGVAETTLFPTDG